MIKENKTRHEKENKTGERERMQDRRKENKTIKTWRKENKTRHEKDDKSGEKKT